MTTATVIPVPADVVTGDVIEHTVNGERVSGLALLVSHESHIIVLDRCDGSLPVAVRWNELDNPAVYHGD